MQLRDFIDYHANHERRSIVRAIADWLEEQARTPDVTPTSEALRRVEANAFRIAAAELREQLECWQ